MYFIPEVIGVRECEKIIGIYFSGTGNSKYAVELFCKEYDNESRTYSIEDNIDEDGAVLVEFRKGDEVRLVIRKAEYILNKQDLEKKC